MISTAEHLPDHLLSEISVSEGFKMRTSTCFLIVSCGLSAVVGLVSETNGQDAAGGEAIRNLRGIDLVVLVDVSSSMGRPSGGNPASDPERIRWDAVKLVLDLLGPADRILVQRFNESCPAGFSSFDTVKERDEYRDTLIKHWFKGREIGFSEEFLQLTERNRHAIADNIGAFNRNDDNLAQGKRYLDYGGTRIVGSLMSVAGQIEQSSAVRTPHVILLTDGLDTDYGEGKFHDAELIAALEAFTRKDAVGNGRIPVHIVGLNLQSEGPGNSRLARELLTGIAHLSGGNFFEVQDVKELTRHFVTLIRQIKGYWIDEFRYVPAEDGAGKTAVSLVINGVVDLGILSYDELANSGNAKHCIQPPLQELELEWVSDEPSPFLKPDVRSGKDNSLYRYLYFGPELLDENRLSSSPFKDLESLGRLNLTMRGNDSEQRLVLLKGIADLFRLLSPEAGATYYRDQTVDIRVEMAPSSHFAPGQFEVTAKFSSVGTGNQQAVGDMVSIPLMPFSDGTDRGFEGSLHLAQLSRLPDLEAEYHAYQVAVSIQGRGAPEIKDHALSGNHRDLPPRVFTVRNYLEIKRLHDIELSNAHKSAEINVETAWEVAEDIELNFILTPPAPPESGDIALPAPKLLVSPNDGRLILKHDKATKLGKATIRVAVDNDESPKHGVVYSPGRILLTHPAGMRMNSPLDLTSRIKLQFDLGRVAFVPESLAQLQAGQSETLSEAIRVQLQPATQPGFDNQTVDLALKQLPTDGTQVRNGTLQNGSESAAEAGNPDRPATFRTDELWLAPKGADMAPAQRSPTLSGIKLGEEFHVHLHPRGEKKAGKYQFRLEATGEKLLPVQIDFDVAVNAPDIELALPAGNNSAESSSTDDLSTMTLYAAPGESPRGVFVAWLSESAIESTSYPVYVKESFVGETVTFQSDTDTVSGHFEVTCPHIDAPVSLLAGKDNAKLLPFIVRVPKGTPYGRYSAELELTGAGVNSRKVTLNVVVNEFAFDIAASDEKTGEAIWRPCNEEEVIQLADLPMTQFLRLRTKLDVPIENPDEVQIQLAGPFQDEAFDPLTLPKLTRVLSSDPKSIWLKIEFNAEPNFNSRGDPYTIAVVADGRQLHVPDARFSFSVRYLLVDRILNSDPVTGRGMNE